MKVCNVEDVNLHRRVDWWSFPDFKDGGIGAHGELVADHREDEIAAGDERPREEGSEDADLNQ